MLTSFRAALFCSLIFWVLTCAQESARGPGELWGQLRVTIVDQGTGESTPARCYLTDPARQFWSPPGAINYVKPPERHFIAPGGFHVALPPRLYLLRVERGLEYRAVTREIEIRSGETHEEKIELTRWINMNAQGWYSGDLHNHRDWKEMPQLLLAEDLNLTPTLTEWIWDDRPISVAPVTAAGAEAFHSVDSTHAYSAFDTEIERLRDGPGAVDLVGLKSPVKFRGTLLSPPNSVFAEAAHGQGGFVDAEKITWRDVAALVALGHVDFAGLVHNHFNRHGVETETEPWGMIPKERPEYSTPGGMPLWAMDVYYKFLNCGFRLPVSAGSASGVKPSPLGFNRVYVHLPSKFGYRAWFRNLKAGRSFATNGPVLFLSVNGHEPGETVAVLRGKSSAGLRRPVQPAGKSAGNLKVLAEANTAGELERLEIVWKGKVVKSVAASPGSSALSAEFEMDPAESGWFAARAFEKPGQAVRFAHTSPLYVKVGPDRGIVPEDAKFFLTWIDREIRFYETLPGFPSDADRQAMLAFFRRARGVYERLASPGN